MRSMPWYQVLQHWLVLARSDGIPRSSLTISLFVGSVLNVINQGDAMLGFVELSWPKLVFTYLVPYIVSTYSAVATRLRHERRQVDSSKP